MRKFNDHYKLLTIRYVTDRQETWREVDKQLNSTYQLPVKLIDLNYLPKLNLTLKVMIQNSSWSYKLHHSTTSNAGINLVCQNLPIEAWCPQGQIPNQWGKGPNDGSAIPNNLSTWITLPSLRIGLLGYHMSHTIQNKTTDLFAWKGRGSLGAR